MGQVKNIPDFMREEMMNVGSEMWPPNCHIYIKYHDNTPHYRGVKTYGTYTIQLYFILTIVYIMIKMIYDRTKYGPQLFLF